MTISVLFFLIHLHLFAQRVNSAPDTHVHIYVPPEPEVGLQGGQVGQGVALNTGVGNSYQPGLDYEGGTNKKTKSESESGTTAVPRSTAANKNPINDGDEGHLGPVAVNCGGHMARQCVDCPTNPDDMSDMGSEWCNGDCEWKASDGFGVPVLGCYEKVENWPMLNCGGHVAEDCQRCPEGAPTRELRESYCNGDCEWDLSQGEWDACTNKTKGLEAKVIEWKYNMEFSGFLDPYRSCAEVGQEVIFKWDPPVGRHAGHLLLQVTKEQYDSCTGFDRPTSGSMTAGEKNVGSFEEGTYYFVNPVDHYCSSGPQRVPVTVPCPNDYANDENKMLKLSTIYMGYTMLP